MQGIYFLLALVAVGIVIHWCLLHDGKNAGAAMQGLLAMKPPTAPVKRVRRKRKAWQHPADREGASETPDA